MIRLVEGEELYAHEASVALPALVVEADAGERYSRSHLDLLDVEEWDQSLAEVLLEVRRGNVDDKLGIRLGLVLEFVVGRYVGVFQIHSNT